MKQDGEPRTARKRRRASGALERSLSLEDDNHATDKGITASLFYSHKPTMRRKQQRVLIILLMVMATCIAAFSRITRHHSSTALAKRFVRPARQGTIKRAKHTITNKSCSCWNTTSKCCDRNILRAHKMGVVLIRDLLQKPFEIRSDIIHPSALMNHSKPDYRHVVITRPIYDSIISGYLYHKSGRECWLDQNGNERVKNKTFEWESKLTFPLLSQPRLNRTLCQYLAEESEQDGVRATVDLALSSWYAGLVPHKELVEQLETSSNSHTLFVCFHELSNPETQESTIQRILDWFYPGGHDFTVSVPRHSSSEAIGYKGGHSTIANASDRMRLNALVQQYDRDLFHGMGDKATKLFGCENQ